MIKKIFLYLSAFYYRLKFGINNVHKEIGIKQGLILLFTGYSYDSWYKK